MNISDKEFDNMNKKISPNSSMLKNCCCAFLIGGFICTIGQVLCEIYLSLGMEEKDARSMVSVTLIFLTALLTGLGIFDKIAKVAGAGTVVPITGFANSITSPAIEFKSEGWVMGVGTKIFSIAGPVIVYGIGSSIVYGIILWIWTVI